jgi:sugar phosphate isomerase/epimerase
MTSTWMREEMITLGSAASPRWFGMSAAGLDEFVPLLASWGATSTELVLHHGPHDERIARVHILESDWRAVGDRFLAEGITCHVHAPLDPRFSLRRWRSDRRSIERGYSPVLQEAARLAERQAAPCVVVVHGAADPGVTDADNRKATAEFLTWAADRCDRDWPGVRLAVELRRSLGGGQPQWDADRTSIVDLVGACDSERVGICWDCGHDWENRDVERDWSPVPPERFLRHIMHVHVHDAGPDGAVHYPLTTGRVPIPSQVDALRRHEYRGAVTMEIRYRHAAACGDPLDMLRRSYERLTRLIGSQVRGTSAPR